MFHVVLVRPEIPQNTGNIARTCAAVGCPLHLIRPLGFSLDDRYLKRAGLDYWPLLDLTVHDSWDDFHAEYEKAPCWFFSTKAPHLYTQADLSADVFLVFGQETAGLPAALLRENLEHALRIPMRSGARSLNLSNAVAVVVYEALRQRGFVGLETVGCL